MLFKETEFTDTGVIGNWRYLTAVGIFVGKIGAGSTQVFETANKRNRDPSSVAVSRSKNQGDLGGEPGFVRRPVRQNHSLCQEPSRVGRRRRGCVSAALSGPIDTPDPTPTATWMVKKIAKTRTALTAQTSAAARATFAAQAVATARAAARVGPIGPSNLHSNGSPLMAWG